jgi:hypothetical protein
MNWCTHISPWPSLHSTSPHLRAFHILISTSHDTSLAHSNTRCHTQVCQIFKIYQVLLLWTLENSRTWLKTRYSYWTRGEFCFTASVWEPLSLFVLSWISFIPCILSDNKFVVVSSSVVDCDRIEICMNVGQVSFHRLRLVCVLKYLLEYCNRWSIVFIKFIYHRTKISKFTILSRDRVTVDGFWIDDRICWTLWYGTWLHFAVHCYTHTHTDTIVHSDVFTSRCSVPASSDGLFPSSGSPKYPRPELPASQSNSSHWLNLSSSD